MAITTAIAKSMNGSPDLCEGQYAGRAKNYRIRRPKRLLMRIHRAAAGTGEPKIEEGWKPRIPRKSSTLRLPQQSLEGEAHGPWN